MKHRSITILLALVTAALIAAGCGGGMSKSEYEKEVNKIGDRVEKKFDAVEEVPTQDDIKSAQKAIDTAVSDLEDLDPPSEISDLHDDLIDTIKSMNGVLDRMAPLMEDATKAMKDPTSVDQDAMTELQTKMEKVGKDADKASAELDRITKAMKKKGVDLDIANG